MANLADPARPLDWTVFAIGAALMGAGTYFGLVGFGVLAAPSKLYGPNWIAVAVALVFAAAGVNIALRGWLGLRDNETDFPPDTPSILVATQWLSAVAVIAALAMIGTWVAFGSGTRHFSMSVPIPMSWSEIVGRAMFGLGAILAWSMAVIFAIAGFNKIFGKKV